MVELKEADVTSFGSSFAEANRPNKAPEPTTFAVTSRAMLGIAELKPQIGHPIAARAAPAKVVAHL